MKQGIGREWDSLPDRMFEPMPEGAQKGNHMDRKEFAKAIDTYYEMLGWKPDGMPTFGKFAELGMEDLYHL